MKKILVFFLCFFFAGSALVFAADDVKIISKEELKAMLDSPELVILDVRRGRDWSSSEYKIKGAVRVESEDVERVASQYGKEKTLVLYCA